MANERPTYVHYGHLIFSKDYFENIENVNWNKPRGGFWASREDAEFGWKQWNEISNYKKCDENWKIVFTLAENARVLEIRSREDVFAMNEKYGNKENAYRVHIAETCVPLDFEKMKEDYDAVEYFISNYTVDIMPDWDCDSIVILNPDIVEQINLEKSIADDILDEDVAEMYQALMSRLVDSHDYFR